MSIQGMAYATNSAHIPSTAMNPLFIIPSDLDPTRLLDLRAVFKYEGLSSEKTAYHYGTVVVRIYHS